MVVILEICKSHIVIFFIVKTEISQFAKLNYIKKIEILFISLINTIT